MKKLTTEEFIRKAKEIHGDKYDYSKVEYVNARSEICIICPIHGEFWQKAANHLNGRGCHKCGIEKEANNRRKNTEYFIEMAKKVHSDKYDYSKSEYTNRKFGITIICPKHGEFIQIAGDHLNGAGCPQCYDERRRFNSLSNIDEFIIKAKKIHGDRYDYSKSEYIGRHKKMCIICPIHGEFWQTPSDHLSGCGCPKCNISRLEEEVMLLLEDNNIVYEYRQHPEWLDGLELDFYLPKHNLAIECQGLQHFESIGFFGGDKNFLYVKNNDKKKLELISKTNIKLLYYSNLNIKYPYEVITDKNKLLEIIQNYEK